MAKGPNKLGQKLGSALKRATALGSREARSAQYWSLRAKLQRKWERAWREKAFHWAALKEHKIEGPPGIANLQDYWRCAAGTTTPRSEAAVKAELVTDEHGVVWHLAHLPFDAKPGTGKSKAQWSETDWIKLEVMIAERVDKAEATETTVDGVALQQDKRALLDGAVLRTLPRETNKPVHLSCAYAQFSKTVVGEAMTYGSCVRFQNALFRHGVRFCNAQFPNGVYFRDAFFARNSEFSGAHFGGRVEFEGSVFCGIAAFRPRRQAGAQDPVPTRFSDVAKFNNVRFHHRANFDEAQFLEKVAFDKSVFHWPANFEGATFRRAAVFTQTNFLRRAAFANATFKKSAHFHGAKFHRLCAFEDADLAADTSFDGAHFRVIDKLAWVSRGVFWATLILAALIIWSPWFNWISAWMRWGLLFVPAAFWFLATRFFVKDVHVERLARAYRQLAKQMEDLSNRKDAARFLRQEQRALRLRWKLNPPGRALSIIYDATSYYGDSVFRPLVLLIVSVAFFACIFWAWRRGGVDEVPILSPPTAAAETELVGAVEFSTQNVVQPFGVWAQPSSTIVDESCPFRSEILATGWRKTQTGAERCHPPWMAKSGDANAHRFEVRVIAALQSLISAILVFLIALAARRRFSVS